MNQWLEGNESVTVSMHMILSHIHGFQKMGGQLPEWVEDALSSNKERLLTSEVRCPASWVRYAIEYAADYLKDPILGLNHPGAEEPLNNFVAELLLRSSSLTEFIWLYSRYFCVFTEIGIFRIIFGKYYSSVKFEPKIGGILCYHQFDAAIYGLKSAIEHARGVQPVKLLKQHSPPEGYAFFYKEKFGCEVDFEQDQTALIYSTKNLLEEFSIGKTRKDTETRLSSSITPKIYRDRRDSLYGQNLEDEIVFLIKRLIFRGEPSRKRVAKELNLSVRTLQRSLSEMSISYKELLESTRKSLAMEYLQKSGFTVAQTATLLGYTESSQFYKAFRRWYGTSPREPFTHDRSL